MDDSILIGGIVLVVLFGPWFLLWRVDAKRKREREELQAEWREFAARISALEHTLHELKRASPAAAEPTQTTPERSVAASYPPATPSPIIASPPPAPPVVDPIASAHVAENWVTRKAPESAAPAVSSVTDRPVPPASPPVTPVSPPTFTVSEVRNLEEMLGTNWLNKLGIVILVLGVAFFLAYQLKTLGPVGKVFVGFMVSGLILGAGIWFERKERYRILARAGVGGGWALLFFTVYAMYHVSAAHVLSSQALDLVLMLAAAAAMVAHTLRYRSQVVTGLAFLLAFLTVTISHSNVYSLSAGAVLAAALVIVVGRMQWFELELFGILASYLNHYLWLRPIIEPMQGKRHPFPEFVASAGILVLYWAIFRISYVFRQPREKQEHISTAAALPPLYQTSL